MSPRRSLIFLALLVGLGLLLTSSSPALSAPGAGLEVEANATEFTIQLPFARIAKVIITITNTGDAPDMVNVELIGGRRPSWLLISSGSFIHLEPGESSLYVITLEPQIRVPEDTITFQVRVSSTRDPSVQKLLSFTATARQQPFHSLPHTAEIQGRVVDAQTGNPIPKARIHLSIPSGLEGMEERSREDGRWGMRLPAGEYFLEVHAPGYRSAYAADISLAEGERLEYEVALEPLDVDAEFELVWEQEVPGPYGVWWVRPDKSWEVIAVSQGKHPPELHQPTNFYLLSADSGGILWQRETVDEQWGLDITPDGSYVAVGSHDGHIYVVNRAGEEVWRKEVPGYCRVVRFSPTGRFLAAGPTQYSVGELGLYETATGNLIWKHESGDWVRSIAFDGAESFVVAGSTDGRIHVLDMEGKLLWRHSTHIFPLFLAVSEDGETIAAGGKSQTLHVFNRDGTLRWSYDTDHVITYGVMSRDGSRIVVGTVGGYIHYLDGEGHLLWRTSMRMYGHQGIGHNAVAMTPDGRYVVIGGGDGSVLLFDEMGTLLWEWSPSKPTSPKGHGEGAVMSVAISDDGTRILAGDGLSYVRLFQGRFVARPTSTSVRETLQPKATTPIAPTQPHSGGDTYPEANVDPSSRLYTGSGITDYPSRKATTPTALPFGAGSLRCGDDTALAI
jgi:WD40 repeat protein